MSNCSNCQKKFAVFKFNRIKCMECGQSYCHQCILKKSYFLYCKMCLILNTRPVNRINLMNVRSREVKLYLKKRNVPIENCLEKEDLINRFIWYVDVEHRLPKNGNKRGNYFNDLMSSLTSSMPNLFETNGSRRNDGPFAQMFRRNENAGASSSNQNQNRTTPVNINTNTTTTTTTTRTAATSNPVPQPAPTTTTTAAAAATTNNVVPGTVQTDVPQQTQRKLVRLKDLKNVEDISNLTVKQLKEVLFINRVDFKGCVEKEELTNKVIKLWIELRSAENSDDLPTEDLCKICMDAPLNSVFLECGHIATCIDCGKQLAECPICRQYIVRVVHTFKS